MIWSSASKALYRFAADTPLGVDKYPDPATEDPRRDPKTVGQIVTVYVHAGNESQKTAPRTVYY